METSISYLYITWGKKGVVKSLKNNEEIVHEINGKTTKFLSNIKDFGAEFLLKFSTNIQNTSFLNYYQC